jgi:hypothetical protein
MAEYLIRVCAHGHRVEYRENYGGWLHMDAPDADVCRGDSTPVLVPVVPRNDVERLHKAIADHRAAVEGAGPISVTDRVSAARASQKHAADKRLWMAGGLDG